MSGIRAAVASSSGDWQGSGISEGLGERAGVLWLGSKVKHSAQEGRAEMSNKVCGPASERRTRCIRGLHPVSKPRGHLDKLASKLNYESVGRSRLSQQSRRTNSRFPDFPA